MEVYTRRVQMFYEGRISQKEKVRFQKEEKVSMIAPCNMLFACWRSGERRPFRLGRSGVRFLGRSNRAMSQTARRCDVSVLPESSAAEISPATR